MTSRSPNVKLRVSEIEKCASVKTEDKTTLMRYSYVKTIIHYKFVPPDSELSFLL